MQDIPEVRYVRSGDVSIAYCRHGEGEEVVVFTPPLINNVELMWELPEWERSLNWAGQHHQNIVLDKRGVGLSDRVGRPSTLEENVADVIAVLDAEKVERVSLVGQSEGGTIAIALAAIHPERVHRLCLVGTPFLGLPYEELVSFDSDENVTPEPEVIRERWIDVVRAWGKPESIALDYFGPSVADDERVRRWWSRFERQSASAGSLLEMLRGFEQCDLREYVHRIQAPTLIGHVKGDRVVALSNARALANAMPHARPIEWSGMDHSWVFGPDWRDIHNDLLEFLTGSRPGSAAREVFATVLFTDIVDSTRRASAAGDTRWREVRALHDAVISKSIASHGGTLVRNTGDGVLVTFNDPLSAVNAALAMSADLAASDIPIRTGIHTGTIDVRDDGEIGGIAVNIAARVQALADAREVFVSQTVRDMLIGARFELLDRGSHSLKGVEGSWQVYAVGS